MPPLALTAGDPSGIAPEIVIAAWRMRDAANVPPFYLLTDPALLAARARNTGLELKIREVTPSGADAVFADALPVVPLTERFGNTLGRPDSTNAAGIIESIDRAVADVFSAPRAPSSPAPSPRSRFTKRVSDFPATPNTSRIWRPKRPERRSPR